MSICILNASSQCGATRQLSYLLVTRMGRDAALLSTADGTGTAGHKESDTRGSAGTQPCSHASHPGTSLKGEFCCWRQTGKAQTGVALAQPRSLNEQRVQGKLTPLTNHQNGVINQLVIKHSTRLRVLQSTWALGYKTHEIREGISITQMCRWTLSPQHIPGPQTPLLHAVGCLLPCPSPSAPTDTPLPLPAPSTRRT